MDVSPLLLSCRSSSERLRQSSLDKQTEGGAILYFSNFIISLKRDNADFLVKINQNLWKNAKQKEFTLLRGNAGIISNNLFCRRWMLRGCGVRQGRGTRGAALRERSAVTGRRRARHPSHGHFAYLSYHRRLTLVDGSRTHLDHLQKASAVLNQSKSERR